MIRKSWFVEWQSEKHSNYFSELAADGFKSREDAIAWAKEAFRQWGNANHPDYVGVWWDVTEVTENQDEFGEWEVVDSETIYETGVCK